MNLVETIKAVQRHYGLHVDGVAGVLTMSAVWRDISSQTQYGDKLDPWEEFDARSAKNLLTLDPKAREVFAQFYRLANATAATYGCDYILIGGNRTWEEQDALFAQGRTIKGSRVTNARGGQSNHNFGIAGDFGVFQGKVYLDGGSLPRQRDLASKVHRACSLHAAACGLEWGGSWKSITDEPHYEVATGLSMMRKRELYREKGSVL